LSQPFLCDLLLGLWLHARAQGCQRRAYKLLRPEVMQDLDVRVRV
jgi:hypothetical protein